VAVITADMASMAKASMRIMAARAGVASSCGSTPALAASRMMRDHAIPSVKANPWMRDHAIPSVKANPCTASEKTAVKRPTTRCVSGSTGHHPSPIAVVTA
jgi:hypothetical protein